MVGTGVGEGEAVAVARGDGAVVGVAEGGGEAVAVEVAVEVAGGAGGVAGLGDGWSGPPPQAATVAATTATTARSCPWKARVTHHNVAAGEANYPTRPDDAPITTPTPARQTQRCGQKHRLGGLGEPSAWHPPRGCFRQSRGHLPRL